jgi:hypothetical protein
MTDKKNEDPSKEKTSAKETEKSGSNSSIKLKEQLDDESLKRNIDETEKTQQEQKETD